MDTGCPENADLLQYAVGAGAAAGDTAGHVDDCPSCQRNVARLWDAIDTIRSTAVPAEANAECLDDQEIARLADAFEPNVDAASVAHLSACARCRAKLSSLIALLRDPAISAEVARLEWSTSPRTSRVLPVSILSGAAAAIIATVMLWPERAPMREPAAVDSGHRAGTVTMTVAPRILAPDGSSSTQDSLRWTSVPHADLYRIRIWDRSGVVIWDGQTRDTVLPLPAELRSHQDTSYHWVVDARTGFDRWVSSEPREFTLRTARGARQ